MNPDLVPGGAGEDEIARFVAAWLERHGLEVERPRNRARALERRRRSRAGSGGGRTLLLNAHLDTVGFAGMDAPLEPRVEDGRLYGRGAYDMKASLAAILLAGSAGGRARAARRRGRDRGRRRGGREHRHRRRVAGTVRADAAIVTEPTE